VNVRPTLLAAALVALRRSNARTHRHRASPLRPPEAGSGRQAERPVRCALGTRREHGLRPSLYGGRLGRPRRRIPPGQVLRLPLHRGRLPADHARLPA
jgi:hypothetical protein